MLMFVQFSLANTSDVTTYVNISISRMEKVLSVPPVYSLLFFMLDQPTRLIPRLKFKLILVSKVIHVKSCFFKI